MNSRIINGVLINTNRSFIRFILGTSISIVEDPILDVMKITFPTGTYSDDLGLPVITPGLLLTEDFINCVNLIYKLNNNSLIKLTTKPHLFRQIIVDDIPTFVHHEETSTIILVNSSDLPNLQSIYNSLVYIKFINPIANLNFNFINLTFRDDKSNSYTSSNQRIYKTKLTFNNFEKREVDYLSSFITLIKTLLAKYDITLIKYEEVDNLMTSTYITYKITEMTTRREHLKMSEEDFRTFDVHSKLDFEFRSSDLFKYQHFLYQYQNLLSLNTITSFKSDDWKASVWWENLVQNTPTQIQGTDSKSNYSFIANFSCTVDYYIKETLPTDIYEILTIIKNFKIYVNN